MVHNFAGLEDTAEPKTKLWLLMGKDLLMSIMSHFFESRLGTYAISAFAVWVLLLVIGYVFFGPTPGHPALHAFAGFLPGMLAMYIATRRFGTPPKDISQLLGSRFDLSVLALFVGWAVVFVIAYYVYVPTRGQPALQVFGGFLIGMVAMYIATHVYGMG